MKQFAILQHPSGEVKAIDLGKNYLAFFLIPVWAGLNKMWGFAAGFAFLDLVMYSAFNDPNVREVEYSSLMVFLIILSYHIYFLVKASSLEVNKLVSEGFVQKEISLSINKDTAISAYSLKN